MGAVVGDRPGIQKPCDGTGVGSGRSGLGPIAIAGGGNDNGGSGRRFLVVQLVGGGGVLSEFSA